MIYIITSNYVLKPKISRTRTLPVFKGTFGNSIDGNPKNGRGTSYFPIQNVKYIPPGISSMVISPVISLRDVGASHSYRKPRSYALGIRSSSKFIAFP